MGEFDENTDSGDISGDIGDDIGDVDTDYSESDDSTPDADSSTEGVDDINEDSYESDDSTPDVDSSTEGADGINEDDAEQGNDADDEQVADTDEIDESQLSPSELYEKGQREMEDAQKEAEDWADENDMDCWSDGTPRNTDAEEGSDAYSEDSSDEDSEQQEPADGEQSDDTYGEFTDDADGEQVDEADNLQQAELESQQEADEERAALEADVKAQAETLNKEYMDLKDRKQAAFDSTIDANNVEDRDRFADEQYKIGEQMEQLRSRIIENNNRLK